MICLKQQNLGSALSTTRHVKRLKPPLGATDQPSFMASLDLRVKGKLSFHSLIELLSYNLKQH